MAAHPASTSRSCHLWPSPEAPPDEGTLSSSHALASARKAASSADSSAVASESAGMTQKGLVGIVRELLEGRTELGHRRAVLGCQRRQLLHVEVVELGRVPTEELLHLHRIDVGHHLAQVLTGERPRSFVVGVVAPPHEAIHADLFA